MRLSFAIYFPPAEPFFAVLFVGAAPQPGKPTFGSSPMRTTMAVMLSAPPCSFASSTSRSAALVGSGSACSVPAISGSVTMRVRPSEQSKSTSLPNKVCSSESTSISSMGAQRAQKNALHVAAFGFGGRQDSAADLFGDKRVVAGELLQIAAAQAGTRGCRRRGRC